MESFKNPRKRGDNMVDNMDKIWSVNDLMSRYNINRASLLEYAKAKESIINATAINMQKNGKEWQFNSQAVRILDELRGYGVVVENYDSPEKAEIERLKEELYKAEQFMLNAQEANRKQLQEISDLKSEIINQLKASEANTALLNAAQGDLVVAQKEKELAIEKANYEKERQQAEIETLKEEHAAVKAEADMLRKELQEAQAALAVEKSKSFWQRIFGN